jgi:hypothetical protein
MDTAKLVRWNPRYYVQVDEEVDHYQYIDLYILKLLQKDIDKLESSDYEVVQSIPHETFFHHYTPALKNIQQAKIDDGEFYIIKESNDWGIVRYFSQNEKQKLSIEIDFRDGVESLSLDVRVERGHKYRPASRKKGIPITVDRFRSFLLLTTHFLFSSNNYLVNLDNYVKKFHALLIDDEKDSDLLISAETPLNIALVQLGIRKEEIEKRLIEHDSDSPVDRAKLRGELEGLNYAVSVINMSTTNHQK